MSLSENILMEFETVDKANLPALRPVEPARVRGFNYSKGRIVEVQLYEVVTGD